MDYYATVKKHLYKLTYKELQGKVVKKNKTMNNVYTMLSCVSNTVYLYISVLLTHVYYNRGRAYWNLLTVSERRELSTWETYLSYLKF